MALDHYVSQVHLARFLSPALGNRLHAFRKSDGSTFAPRTRDVCWIEDGSTNSYLQEPRAIEQFLTTVELNYNAAVQELRDGSSGFIHNRVIAGFAAYASVDG